jgi:hypothetical protein
LFTDPKANRKTAKDAFLVQQANIYVTQVRGLLLTCPPYLPGAACQCALY